MGLPDFHRTLPLFVKYERYENSGVTIAGDTDFLFTYTGQATVLELIIYFTNIGIEGINDASWLNLILDSLTLSHNRFDDMNNVVKNGWCTIVNEIYNSGAGKITIGIRSGLNYNESISIRFKNANPTQSIDWLYTIVLGYTN